MVTDALPVDVKITDCAGSAFTTTLPKAKLVALMLSVRTAAFNCREKLTATGLEDLLPALAISVTACAVATDEKVAVNAALVALAGTVTVVGTVTAVLLLDRLTLRPPLEAGALSVTVQASVPEPVSDELIQVSALTAAGDGSSMKV
jgi:hypothetical protein